MQGDAFRLVLTALNYSLTWISPETKYLGNSFSSRRKILPYQKMFFVLVFGNHAFVLMAVLSWSAAEL